jgi:inosine/xanthosine triphosphate pyrophosphatase family protein
MATPKIINFATGNKKKLEEVPACLHANSLHPDQDRPNRFEP